MKTKSVFYVISIVLFLAYGGIVSGQDYQLLSPDNNIKVEIQIQKGMYYSVYYQSKQLILPSKISLIMADKQLPEENPKIKNTYESSKNEKLTPVVKDKREIIIDNYNEILLEFRGNYGVIFRAYNDGIAYRFFTKFNKEIRVIDEEASFNFAVDDSVYIPFEESFFTHSEREYSYLPLSEITSGKMSCVPVLVNVADGPKIAITEADLEDYPGMYLIGDNTGSPYLTAIFPHVALEEEQMNDRDVKITEREDIIAVTNGNRFFPWRVIMIAKNDGDLINNDIVYRLAKPLQLQETAWIKPGKVAWDWWNALNVYDVDFESGINTKTYKYYVDFASDNNIEYIILDEGWSDTRDLLKINPNLDLNELLDYAAKKDVGIILWMVWKTLDDQLHEALDKFQEWGIKGIKVDFMQRDDQWMVNYYHKIAKEAAKRQLLVDFHGAYKPTGLRRAYPNVLTREGVRGLEWNKWSEVITPEHNVTIPFTRMLGGPMDYTPGAMVNAQKNNFRILFNRPMSQGTRIHQLAMYVIYESALQMLADNPTNYIKEPEIMDFLSKVPTVWDETKVLNAKIADYVTIARRSGDEWYVGSMTDWTPRTFNINFSFLDPGTYTIDIYSDGINAGNYASDYKKTSTKITNEQTIQIKLVSGGGWAARIFQEKPDNKTSVTNQILNKNKQILNAQTGEERAPTENIDQSLSRNEIEYRNAKEKYDKDPGKLDIIIWLGRRAAYLSRYQEAIDIYSSGINKYPDSPELYRHRGHRYISTRQFDKAIADFKNAAELSQNKPISIEPDGQPNKMNIPLSNLHFNIWYHLGLAYYLKGEFDEAIPAYIECLEYSVNDDLLTATCDWLYMSYRRSGKNSEAEKLLEKIHENMEIVENQSYYNRLLMYKGLKKPEQLLDLNNRDEDLQLDIVTQGYGVGNWFLYNGDIEKAIEIFNMVLTTGLESAFGYIAAEVDIKSLKK